MHNTFFKLVLLVLICTPKFALGQEEEVILSSAGMKEAEEWNTRLVVKPKYRYVDSLELKGMLSIALQPNLKKYPGNTALIFLGDGPGFGMSLVAGYERFISYSGFTFFLENTLRLYSAKGVYYDYLSSVPASNGNTEEFPERIETREANIYSLDFGVKYYFRIKKKKAYGATGINPFNEYMFLKFKDVVNYAEEHQLTYYIPNQYLLRRVDSRKWVIEPSYFFLGVGLQRRFLERGLADFYLGAGVNLLNNRTHYRQNILIEIGLNIGLWIGKKK